VRVFVIGTGRCGTRTFRMACRHITNFTSAHESHARKWIGWLDYPDNHIEIDHHLTWALPLLLDKYPPGAETLYVHLARHREDCVRSLQARHLMDLFAELCCFVDCSSRTPDKRRAAAEFYVDSLTRMIDRLLPRGQSMWLRIEELADVGWPKFWPAIGAQGDYDAAVAECRKRYNRGLESKGEEVRDEH